MTDREADSRCDSIKINLAQAVAAQEVGRFSRCSPTLAGHHTEIERTGRESFGSTRSCESILEGVSGVVGVLRVCSLDANNTAEQCEKINRSTKDFVKIDSSGYLCFDSTRPLLVCRGLKRTVLYVR